VGARSRSSDSGGIERQRIAVSVGRRERDFADDPERDGAAGAGQRRWRERALEAVQGGDNAR